MPERILANGESQRANSAQHQHSPNGHPTHIGPVWDFLTATRDTAAFRRIRDDFPDFDLADVQGADEMEVMLWRLRCEYDAPTAQNGELLDDAVAKVLRALADVNPVAGVALEWLTAHATVYKLSDAPKVARRLVEGWRRAPRFEVFSFADMAKLPRASWLIRGLLVERTVSNISADSGGFKSFLALEMALCIATGTPFFGREVKRGAAVYGAAEGFYTILERATAWAQVRGVELPGNFHVLRVPVNVADILTLQEFAATVEGFDPVFVVLDTLSQNAIGLNENSNDEMARFMAGMARLGNEIGAHVMAVHHNAKASGTFRGAGAIKANVDTHITLERPDDDDTNTVFVRCEKQRGKTFEPFALRGVEVEVEGALDEYGDAITSLVFEPCGDAVTAKAKHLSSQKADKTREQLLVIFDEIADEWKGAVKSGTWRARAIEAGICENGTFYRQLKALAPDDGSGPIVKEGAVYRRTANNSHIPTIPISQNGNVGIVAQTPPIPNSHIPTPFRGGNVGISGGSAGNGKKSAHKSTAQSEPYAAPVAIDDEIFGACQQGETE